ncbi:CBS domain-containing protein [Actinoplanes sp. NBRC 14428]|uniref:BON domain-containing protein n=1 Tax=Pseudosporangium ferrugineum TaxID=439699 RepID=A0A2T0SG66_9ACTN|nr:CBS domain-containing protein [Pseudosporangium ferrugineum]PRY32395.1 BON domain-containing protein [Pseudosporangium ferrugineum]BCJ49355.1 CBS domain-containing protein [Actinoplanes sp. NBRC 14428]
MHAKDIMTSPVHVVRQDASVESAAELMTAKAVTALPVVDAAGLLVGMVSESDLLWHRVPSDPTAHMRRHPDTDPARRPGLVAEVMAPFPLTTTPDADVAEVADTMLQNDVRSLPVVDDRDVIGIISRRDILRAMVRSDDVLVREVQHRLDEYADGDRRWTAVVEGGVATVTGTFTSDTERAVVQVLARTVPGVALVRVHEA